MAHVATIGTATSSSAVSTLSATLTAAASTGHTVVGAVVWESGAGSIPCPSHRPHVIAIVPAPPHFSQLGGGSPSCGASVIPVPSQVPHFLSTVPVPLHAWQLKFVGGRGDPCVASVPTPQAWQPSSIRPTWFGDGHPGLVHVHG